MENLKKKYPGTCMEPLATNSWWSMVTRSRILKLLPISSDSFLLSRTQLSPPTAAWCVMKSNHMNEAILSVLSS